MKLIGAPDRTIIGMIVQQALALGLIGFAVGATLIVNVKDHFPRRVANGELRIDLHGVVAAILQLATNENGTSRDLAERAEQLMMVAGARSHLYRTQMPL